MKRVEGTSGIKLIECVSPARNRWRIRWDVQEREDGSASYMEEGFVGRPHMDTIKSVITDWCNEQIDREILSGFSMKVCRYGCQVKTSSIIRQRMIWPYRLVVLRFP